MKVCLFEECGRSCYGRKDWCRQHWRQVSSGREPWPIGLQPSKARRKYDPVCVEEECNRPASVRGRCRSHSRRLASGELQKPIRNQAPKGTGYLSPRDGYRWVPAPEGHPNSNGKSIAEHRLVMTQILGRALAAGETVHHKNGDRADNRPENLELWTTKQPYGQRVTDKIKFAVEILEQYAPDKLA